MLQRDYISKILEEMADIPAKVVGLRTEGKTALALERVNDFYRTYPRFDKGLITLLPASEIASRCKLDVRELEPLAAMLAEEGELLQLAGQDGEAMRKWAKALELLEYLNEKDKQNYSVDRNDRIKLLREKS
jgi:hypothetical protein